MIKHVIRRTVPRVAAWVVCPLLAFGAGYSPDLYQALRWRNIGPFRGGRVTTVAGVVDQPRVYYFGATGGGVWKSEDGGSSWHNISDGFFHSGSIGAIAVAPSDSNVLYAGTGEACVRSNFGEGDGIYRSSDAGRTWQKVGLEDSRQIGSVQVDPRDPDRVYVAALGHIFSPSRQRGVFRSLDGGKSWEKVLYVDDKTGAVDLAMDPHNPRIIFAAMWQVHRTPWRLVSGGPGSGLYRSTDGGDHWQELTRGLPRGIKGRIGVTVSPARPGRVWAIVEAHEGGVFRSDDGGNSWIRLNHQANIRERPWYYSHIFADTQDPDTVYVLTGPFQKSIDGGSTFKPIPVPHGDNHGLWIDPCNNQRMINSNDGGANVSNDGGKSWTTQMNQPTAQFYHVITDKRFPYRVYGAQQDNTTVSIASRSNGPGIGLSDWYPVGGGESGYIAPDPRNPDVVYAGSYYGLLTRYERRLDQIRNISVWPVMPMGRPASDVKYRFQWTFPIVIPAADPGTLYAAANVLFKSTDSGGSWQQISPDLTRNDREKEGPTGGPITGDNSSADYYDTIFTVAPSPLQKGLIWTGSDDGLVHVTRDEGKHWQNVTPGQVQEWSRINIIEASHFDPAVAYLAVNRYQLNDRRPYIYKTEDYGRSWQLLVNGIPDDCFVRVVREDPAHKGLLYAGTEQGAFFSADGGQDWQSLQLNLPVVPITDLAVQNDELVASTQGRSFWILDDLTPLRQLTPQVAGDDSYLFQPGETIRLRRGQMRISSQSLGTNPANGVSIYYYFKEKPQKPVVLEFLDAGGNLIKRFQSGGGEASSAPAPSTSFFGTGTGSSRPSANQGMNEFVWDMRYPDAAPVPGDSIVWGGTLRGPVAVPGRYQVRLRSGDRTLTQSFQIEKDPRLQVSDEAYQKQFDLLIRIRDRLSQTHQTAAQILGLLKDLERAGQRSGSSSGSAEIAAAAGQLRTKLLSIRDQLIQVRIKSGNDVLSYAASLNSFFAGLARSVAAADAAPTRQSYQAFNELSSKLDEQLARFKEVAEKDIPAFNRLMERFKVPALPVHLPSADGKG